MTINSLKEQHLKFFNKERKKMKDPITLNKFN